MGFTRVPISPDHDCLAGCILDFGIRLGQDLIEGGKTAAARLAAINPDFQISRVRNWLEEIAAGLHDHRTLTFGGILRTYALQPYDSDLLEVSEVCGVVD